MKSLIEQAKKIVIIQADNPDGDSLSSALALEHILGDMGKEIFLYCGVDIPDYLKYMDGWDRVSKDIPNNFDLSIIVDTSANGLMEQIASHYMFGKIKHTPCIVIDHHDEVDCDIPYVTHVINQPAASTTQVIYEIAQEQGWELSKNARDAIVYGILSDTLGLTTDSVSARTVQIISECIEGGVLLAELDEKRRQFNKKSQDIFHYKGKLIERTEFLLEGRLACVTIPWEEIQTYSQSYNPAMLVLDEMRMVEGVEVAIVYKLYKDGKITGKIRCNRSAPVAKTVAKALGGDGHIYASGFKVQSGLSYSDVRTKVESVAFESLENLKSQ